MPEKIEGPYQRTDGATIARNIADHFTEERLVAFGNVNGVVPFVHELGWVSEPMGVLRRTLSEYIREHSREDEKYSPHQVHCHVLP